MTIAIKRCALAVTVGLLTACKDDAPPHLRTICDETDTQMVVSFVYTQNGVRPVITPVTQCVRSHVECVPAGAEYAGNLTCEDVVQ